jgi:hypothetical protein
MLEKMLSKSGLAVAVIALILFGGGIAWATFTDSPPASWLIDAQDALLGAHSLKLTFVLLFLPAAAAGYGLGFLWDYLTGQGVFRKPGGVRILATPPGEAPEHIRKAWVGLVLPLAEPGLRIAQTRGVLSSRRLEEPSKVKQGYVVDARGALAVLAESDPAAAAWWEENVPSCRKAGSKLMFEAEVCEQVEGCGPAGAPR